MLSQETASSHVNYTLTVLLLTLNGSMSRGDGADLAAVNVERSTIAPLVRQ